MAGGGGQKRRQRAFVGRSGARDLISTSFGSVLINGSPEAVDQEHEDGAEQQPNDERLPPCGVAVFPPVVCGPAHDSSIPSLGWPTACTQEVGMV